MLTLSERIEHIYRSIADHYYRHDRPVALEFDWCGGEPLLFGPDFYWRTFDQQTKIFDDPQVTVTNVVQTKLTVLNEPLIKLLFEGFDGVGVSLDLFSGARASAGGSDANSTVLRNIDGLRDAGVRFGCITVLSRRNRARLEKIVAFFAEAAISVRILPLHRGADDFQDDDDLLMEEEVRDAFIALFDMWIENPAPIIIEPIYSFTEQIILAAAPDTGARRYYDKRNWESVYIAGAEGNLYSYADALDVSMAHGNLFEESLRAMVGGRATCRPLLRRKPGCGRSAPIALITGERAAAIQWPRRLLASGPATQSRALGNAAFWTISSDACMNSASSIRMGDSTARLNICHASIPR